MPRETRGGSPILVMPPDEWLRVDVDSLQQLVDFVVE